MQLFDLGGKVALVTGSTKDIGFAIARRQAEHGAKLAVSSRKADACEAAAEIDRLYGKGGEIAAPMRRFGEPDDIAGAAVFLASPASAWMTDRPSSSTADCWLGRLHPLPQERSS
jgi:NAD(P)-dependent dehydrogenase (short-subunit alcohol dehydrogenase family)